jgi:hypothetical protein
MAEARSFPLPISRRMRPMNVTTEPQSFRTWLTAKAQESSAIGDLARDIAHDPGFPSNPSPKEAVAYLAERSPMAADLMKQAASLYKKETARS